MIILSILMFIKRNISFVPFFLTIFFLVFFESCAYNTTYNGKEYYTQNYSKYRNWLSKSWQQQDSPWRECGQALSEISDIEYVIIDPDTRLPIFIGPKQQAQDIISPIALDDLITAFNLINYGHDPGISIEPEGGINPFAPMVYTSPPSEFTVRYIPSSLENTHLGYLLFEADRTLKPLCLGRDNLTGGNFVTSIPDYKSVPRRMKGQVTGAGFFAAPIFQPKKVELQREENAIRFDRIAMGVSSQSNQTAAIEFTEHLEEYFDLFAKELPSLQELIRVTKLVAIARWLNNDVSGFNCEELSKYKSVSFPTPTNTPVITAEVTRWSEGPYIKIAVLCGGVLLSTENSYISAIDNNIQQTYVKGNGFSDLAKIVLLNRPSKASISWDIYIQEKAYKAIEIPLRRISN